eukprot:CAMPEP_0116920442 /NCGR_PEP_ID=MMETSP0467-20121206/21019_1 /TAXON_ID=283647 /ORGANISM="Mesodinium pulex, Strain SPMC105" /LENGTH=46 /DNA_ID= /DNA_START= /DNA_END= /DNA_ORIENTATION=
MDKSLYQIKESTADNRKLPTSSDREPLVTDNEDHANQTEGATETAK